MSTIPFPPPPEYGWYDDDAELAGSETFAGSDFASADSAHSMSTVSPEGSLNRASSPVSDITDRKMDIANAKDDIADEDWDGTVLSSAFTAQTPTRRYLLVNDQTGQSVTLERSTLLGRRPSATVPEGAASVRLDDPTRTMSRNHAAISFAKNGKLWIEDYGSLNGTYVIHGSQEIRVMPGTPIELEPPAVLRMGDQFMSMSEPTE